MAEDSKISWTHSTFNYVLGCQRVSPACQNCYAEAFVTGRMGRDVWGPTKPRHQLSESYWKGPLKWNKQALASGNRHRVFCASLADVFEDHPDCLAPRNRLFRLIEATPALDWLLLTKRPENMLDMAHDNGWLGDWPRNVWAGTTVENQEYADKRIPELVKVPAVVRFLSIEPMLGPINLMPYLSQLQWVIVGGESGPKSRKTELDWMLEVRDQCELAHPPVSFFVKQMGKLLAAELGMKDNKKGGDLTEFPADLQIQRVPFVSVRS